MLSTRKTDRLNLRILKERGCAMYTEILNNDELVELRAAYEKACEELRLGMNGEDTVRREQLALVMLSLAKGGERDPNVVRIQAVHQMQQPS